MKYKYIFVLFYIAFLYGCDNIFLVVANKEKNIKNEKILPQIKNFYILKANNGIKIWELKSESAYIDEEKNFVHITSGSVKIYDKNADYLASINFLSAFLFLDNYDIFFKDKNIIHTVENEKIITYDMKYIAEENKLVSDKEIIIYRDKTIINGIGFETINGFKTIKIWKNVITEG